MKRLRTVLVAALLAVTGLTSTAHADPPSPPMGLAFGNAGSNRCATEAGPGFDYLVFVSSCSRQPSNPRQHWYLYMRYSPDIYELRNDDGNQTGRCAEVENASTKDGAAIKTRPCEFAKASQMWRVNVYEWGARNYTAIHSNKCLAYEPSGSIFAVQKTCSLNTRWEPVGLFP